MSPRKPEWWTSGPGMSSCWFDYDNDGNFDLYVSDMWEASGMRLTFADGFLGAHAPGRPRLVPPPRQGKFPLP